MPKKISRATCAAQHFGAWAIEPKWFRDAVSAVKAGTWKPQALADDSVLAHMDQDADAYSIVDGVATIHLEGHLTKHRSSFGGTSTIDARRAIRRASEDSLVRSIVLVIDSPGGTVNGVSDLADDVKKYGASKPIYAFIDGQGCSAAYWVASQAKRIYANRTSAVGCIGVYTVLVDDTGAQDQAGVRYVLVSTGKFKGLGADGAVTKDLKADVQREIDEINAEFKASVMAGRGFTAEKMEQLADGRVHIGDNALTLGLINEVATLDVAMEAVTTETELMTLEQFNAYAKEHPEATKPFRDEATAAAKAEHEKALAKAADDLKAAQVTATDEATKLERERCVALTNAFKDTPDFLAKEIAAGHDVAKAKVEHYDTLVAKVKDIEAKKTPESNTGAPAAGFKGLENKGGDAEVSDARRKELLGMTSLGQTVLSAK